MHLKLNLMKPSFYVTTEVITEVKCSDWVSALPSPELTTESLTTGKKYVGPTCTHSISFYDPV